MAIRLTSSGLEGLTCPVKHTIGDSSTRTMSSCSIGGVTVESLYEGSYSNTSTLKAPSSGVYVGIIGSKNVTTYSGGVTLGSVTKSSTISAHLYRLS